MKYEVVVVGDDVVAVEQMSDDDGQTVQNVVLDGFVAQFLEQRRQIVLRLAVRRRGSLPFIQFNSIHFQFQLISQINQQFRQKPNSTF